MVATSIFRWIKHKSIVLFSLHLHLVTTDYEEIKRNPHQCTNILPEEQQYKNKNTLFYVYVTKESSTDVGKKRLTSFDTTELNCFVNQIRFRIDFVSFCLQSLHHKKKPIVFNLS